MITHTRRTRQSSLRIGVVLDSIVPGLSTPIVQGCMEHDGFIQRVLNKSLFRWNEPVDTRLALSCYGTLSTDDNFVRGYKPRLLGYSQSKDYATYSNPYAALTQQLRYPRGKPNEISPYGQHQVKHTQPEGFVSSVGDADELYPRTGANYSIPGSGLSLPTLSGTGTAPQIRGTAAGSSVSFTARQFSGQSIRYFLDEVLPAVETYLSTGVIYTIAGTYYTEVKNLKYGLARMGYPLWIEYDVFHTRGNNAFTKYEGTQRIDFEFSPTFYDGALNPIGDRNLSFKPNFKMRLAFHFSYAGEKTGPGGTYVSIVPPPDRSTVYVPPIVAVTCASKPSPDTFTGVDKLISFCRMSKYSEFTENRSIWYDDIVSADLSNLVAATSISTADAVDKFLDVIKTNHLETLSELGGILSLIPKIGLLYTSIVQAKRGNLIDAGKTLLDFLSDTKLLVEFGINPLDDSITEIKDKLPDITERFKDLRLGQRTLHGKFTFTLPEPLDPAFDKTVLIVRSAVRLEFDDSSILLSIIGGRCIGLLPQLSNLWDLIPWSFAVDWFTSTSRRLGVTDSNAVILATKFNYAVHSYEVVSTFKESYLNSYGLTIPSYGIGESDPPSMKYYGRFVSQYVPNIRIWTSKYDFFPSRASSVDLGIVGSLLWKRIS